MNTIEIAIISMLLGTASVQDIVPAKNAEQGVNIVVMERQEEEKKEEKEPDPPASYIIEDIHYISQLPGYPNGCEIVSSTMVLNYYQNDITPDDMIENYITMGETPIVDGIGPNPADVFCGDPRKENGWGCEATVIGDAIDKMGIMYALPEAESLEELCKRYVVNSNPVIVWATLNMQPSNPDVYVSWHTEDGEEMDYNVNQHCMVLVGYDEEKYYFYDPLKDGDERHLTAYDKDASDEAFRTMGCQSIVVKRAKQKFKSNPACEVK